MASEEHFAVQGNTCTVVRWHLDKTSAEKKGKHRRLHVQQQFHLTAHAAEADRKAALESSEAARESADLETRFRVTRDEQKQSETGWKAWMAKRFDEQGTPDFVSNWRDFVPAAEPEEEKVKLIGEARFSKVVVALHDKCILCEAMETVRVDHTLSHADKMQRLRRLEHSVPKLQISALGRMPIASGSREESILEGVVIASAWGQRSVLSAREHTADSVKGRLGNMLTGIGNVESTVDIREGQHKLSQSITESLVNSVPGDGTEITNKLISHKAFTREAETVRQRVNLYRANRNAARSALIATNTDNQVSDDNIERAAKAKADALELERDLAILEMRQNATKARKEQLKKGHGRSALQYSRRFCEMRRYKWRAGIDMEEDDELGPRQEVDYSSAKNSPFAMIKMMRQELQEQRSIRGTSPPPGDDTPVSSTLSAHVALADSPGPQSEESQAPSVLTKSTEAQTERQSAPSVLTESPEAVFEGPSAFANTMQAFNRHTREQEDNASVSTCSNPFGLEEALDVVPITQQAAEPSANVATASSSKGKGKAQAKKDSKVEDLLEEDGISLKDFAPEPERKKGKPFRTLSVKAGSSSRLQGGSSPRGKLRF
ncbi:hypothetical protein N0V86_005140 [Didymella sp. IMI 355093]|nr:hypothetical protein N0V86_005140 [Didymella sp. IMI 355093]